MPHRLKSLELLGYKTFAARTTFEFPGLITAIVGPNGSGKSNITDGLRWVLGEQSYGLLRGKKTEDMIFAGSEGKPRAGMASATIQFDNTEGWLPIDYSEVAITRRAYRDGQNEYLLNGQRVRLRDITELLSQSGMSERTYTIIGQGMVDAALALRPEERRKLFEEAAGIGLYRSRREEALNRLENTHRNIQRVQDILAELEPRLNQLERQAKKAMEYDRVKADLRMILREWYGYHWYMNQQELAHQKETVRHQEKSVTAARTKYGELNRQVMELRAKIQEVRTQLNTWHGQASAYHNEKEAVSREIAIIDERIRSLTDQSGNYLMDQSRLNQEIESTRENLITLEDELQTMQEELQESRGKSEDVKEKLDKLRELKTSRENALADLRRKLNQAETAVIQYQTQVEEKTNRRKTLQATKDSIQKSIDENSMQIDSLQEEVKNSRVEKENLESAIQQIQLQISALKRDQNQITANLQTKQTRIHKLQGNIAQLKIEMDVIQQAEKSLTGYSTGAKQLLMLIRKGDIKGMETALSSNLVIPQKYEMAVSAALGDFLDSVVVADEKSLDSALASLENTQNARSALLTSGFNGKQEVPRELSAEGCMGSVLDVIQYPPEYKNLLAVILGGAYIFEQRSQARKAIQSLPGNGRAITLNGEVFFANGAVIGGKAISSARISRPRQYQDMEAQVKELQKQMDAQLAEVQAEEEQVEELTKRIHEMEGQTSEKQGQLRVANQRFQQITLQEEKARRQFDWSCSQQINIETEGKQLEVEISRSKESIQAQKGEVQKLNDELASMQIETGFEEMDNLQSEYNFQQTNIAVNTRAINDLQRRINEKREFLKTTQLNTQSIETKSEQIKSTLAQLESEKITKKALEEIKSKDLSEIQLFIQPAEDELVSLEETYNNLLDIENNSQNALATAEKYQTQAQMDYAHKKEGMELLRRRIEEDFGLVAFEYTDEQTGPTPLPFEGMVEELPRVEVLPADLEDNLIRHKAMLRRMGAVNPEAQSEYQTTAERYEFLKTQISDLFKAEEDVKKILLDLDQLMRSEFHHTFRKVSEEFPQMFNRLFGGGTARLALTDPENIHDTGVEIHARLPGKREQELTLLSGGERSLTAVALIFALLKISPTPFCVLDEVDAALDETNVGRFRDLLVELSKDIQFILVTHNRNTVQAANVIYGITMGKDSTSQSISLRLDEVSDEMLKKEQ